MPLAAKGCCGNRWFEKQNSKVKGLVTLWFLLPHSSVLFISDDAPIVLFRAALCHCTCERTCRATCTSGSPQVVLSSLPLIQTSRPPFTTYLLGTKRCVLVRSASNTSVARPECGVHRGRVWEKFHVVLHRANHAMHIPSLTDLPVIVLVRSFLARKRYQRGSARV